MVTKPLGTSDGARIGLIDGAWEAVIALEEFNRRLGVDGWIRLHPVDFAGLPAGARRFVHFNLGTTTNSVGLRYALVPIRRPGSRSAEGIEQLPFVDVSGHRVGRCIEVRQRVAVTEVGQTDFAASLPHVRNTDQLCEALVQRYAKMHPDMTHAELLAAGCAITTIDLDAR